jgi:hypothetical protein
MVQHTLDRGYEVVGVCREQSVGILDAFKGRLTVVPGATDDLDVIERGRRLSSAIWAFPANRMAAASSHCVR